MFEKKISRYVFYLKNIFEVSNNVKFVVFQYVTISNGCEKKIRCVFDLMNDFNKGTFFCNDVSLQKIL